MNVFLARQAIYNRDIKVVAYELLFRNSEKNVYDASVNADNATIKLMSNCSAIGLDDITEYKIAYINFTENLILNDYAKFLPKEKIVIEILENIDPTDKVINKMIDLRNEGYRIALDDVDLNSMYIEFGKLIDIYKIDFIKTNREQREELIKNLRLVNPTAKILAEKVETESDFQEILDNKDYSYYQGYYFSRPIIVAGKDIPIRNNTYFKVMSELTKDDFDVNSIEKTIKLDVGISFKLFKLLNSSAFSFDNEIKSIKQAIMILGKEELYKWITVVAMSEMESANSDEMTRSNIIRGNFCENIAKKINSEHSSECFMAGLFSNLDKYMQKQMDKVVSELPISDLVKEALTKRNNMVGYILTLAESYENMQIEKINTYAAIVGINKDILVELYFKSIEWTKMVLFE